MIRRDLCQCVNLLSKQLMSCIHVDLSHSWQVKVWENKRLWAEKDMALEEKEKGMALGKRAWRWEKGAWRGAMLKGAGGNTILSILHMISKFQNVDLGCMLTVKKICTES